MIQCKNSKKRTYTFFVRSRYIAVDVIITYLRLKVGNYNQGGEGEVVGQLSFIYETITTKILKKLKKFFI